MKNVQFVLNQQQDLISVFQVVMHVKERFLKHLLFVTNETSEFLNN